MTRTDDDNVSRDLTYPDVMARLDVSRSTVDRLRKAGRLRSFRLGRCVRFDPATFEEDVARLRAAS